MGRTQAEVDREFRERVRRLTQRGGAGARLLLLLIEALSIAPLTAGRWSLSVLAKLQRLRGRGHPATRGAPRGRDVASVVSFAVIHSVTGESIPSPRVSSWKNVASSLAVALSLLILTGYSLLFGPRCAPPQQERRCRRTARPPRQLRPRLPLSRWLPRPDDAPRTEAGGRARPEGPSPQNRERRVEVHSRGLHDCVQQPRRPTPLLDAGPLPRQARTDRRRWCRPSPRG